jgi:hypothetical protein
MVMASRRLISVVLAMASLMFFLPDFARGADPLQFSPVESLSMSGPGYRMAAGDFNRDGHPDLATVHNTNKYSVLLNNGAGGFTAASYTADGELRDAAVTLLPGDTVPDLVFSDGSANKVLIFSGNGDGTFTQVGTGIASGSGTDGLAVADLNRDGYPDVAVGNRSYAKIAVLLGNAGGAFEAAVQYTTSASGFCTKPALGLMDGDSILDLVTANGTNNSVSVLLGNGAGGFGAARRISAGSNNTEVGLADFDGDGKLDAAVGAYNSSMVVILQGDGLGGLRVLKSIAVGSKPSMIAVTDVNQDGRADIVTANSYAAPGLSVILSYGHGTFTGAYRFHPDQKASGLAIADFDGPGPPDLVTTHPDKTVRVLKGLAIDLDHDLLADADEPWLGTSASNPDSDGDGMIDGYEAAQRCLGPAVYDAAGDGDLDGAGNLDEFLRGTEPCAAVDSDGDGLGDGWEIAHPCLDPIFADAGLDPDLDQLTNLQEFQFMTDPCVADDQDGDGMPDGWELKYLCVSRSVNDAGLDPDHDQLTNLAEFLAGSDPCAAVDTDGDGLPDAWELAHPCLNRLVSDAGLDYDNDLMSNRVEYQNGTDPCVATQAPVAFGPADSYAGAATPFRMAEGDFNGDGKADFVVVHDMTPAYTVLLSNGDGTLSASTNAVGSWPRDVAVARLDGDAYPDLLISDWNGRYVSVLMGNGDGTFTPGPTLPTGGQADGIVTSDFNRDGTVDLAVCNRPEEKVAVMLGNGSGGFSGAVQYGVAGSCMELAVGLLDADSVPDLVTANYWNNSITVLLGNGSGGFGPASVMSVGAYNADVALGDLDGDGKLDAALAAEEWGQVVLLRGDGLGGFQTWKSLPVGPSPHQIRLADLNGDGSLDLATANRGGGPGLSVILGDGHGWFNAAYSFHSDSAANGLAVGDVDPASLPDIATAHGAGAEVRLLRGVVADTDADLLSDGQELLQGTSVSNPDTDGDGMPDFFEVKFLCLQPLVADAGADPDSDGVNNLQEYLGGADPCVSNDADGDWLPDVWELAHGCMAVAAADGNEDYDADSLTNMAEYQRGTDPCAFTDTDADGMPDGWEDQFSCVSKLIADSGLDRDRDTQTNLQEYQAKTSPCAAVDNDGDGMADLWEAIHPCLQPGVADGNLDADGDLLTNLTEFQTGTDPCVLDDTDGDGMPDAWEDRYACVNKRVGDAGADPDVDTRTNLQEFQAGTNPCVVNDADADGMPDFWELAHACMKVNVADANADYDLDTAGSLFEFQHGLDPCLVDDRDADGVPDGWELRYACVDVETADAGLDPDTDGLSNLAEYQLKTSPCLADTDGDGLDDHWEGQYACMNPLKADAGEDPDFDAFLNLGEYQRGLDPCVLETRGRVLVVIHPSLEGLIDDALAQYQIDLEHARFTVIYYHYTAETPEELRAILIERYNEPDSLAGAVLMGDIPYAVYNDGSAQFPCDLFYMDVNGTWTDTNGNHIYHAHTGEKLLDIWVSRLWTDNLPVLASTEAEIINAYLDKDHRYRTGALAAQSRGLIYVDGGLTLGKTLDMNAYKTPLEGIYGPGSVSVIENQTPDYILNVMMQTPYEWVDWASHAGTDGLSLYWNCGGMFACSNNRYVTSAEILAANPKWFFAVVGGCGASSFPSTNYVTGVLTFGSGNAGLVNWGSTRAMDPGIITFFQDFTTVGTAGMIMQNWYRRLYAGGGTPTNFYGGVMIGDGALQLRMSLGDYDGDGLPNYWEQTYSSCLDAETVDNALDPDADGLDNAGEFAARTNPCLSDSDNDLLPDGIEAANRANPLGALDPLYYWDAGLDFDGDGNNNLNEFWNGSDLWAPDPRLAVSAQPACYYWGDGDGDGVPAPSDLVMLKLEVAGVAQDYRYILPHGADTLDLDRDGNAAPSDGVLLTLMLAGSERPGGYPSQAALLEVVAAPSGSVAVGSTTHVTLSVHSVSGDVPYAPGFGVVFTVDSGSAKLIGGDGTVEGQGWGNRYDFSMEAASGAKANIVVLVTGPDPITIGAKVPACGSYPNGRWNDEVVLSPPVVINGL